MEIIMENVRIGIFGLGRGGYYIDNILANNGDVVAVCDSDEAKVKEAEKKLGSDVAKYSDFNEFIKHPMDAVFLANCFHEHAEYAIRCLEKNIHVLSECCSNSTMAEGVRLVRAAEKSKAFYMLAENYPFMIFNQEMKRVFEGGSLGKLMYAEGEYNHPCDPYDIKIMQELFLAEKHWRNFLPGSYYITHSLAPIMYATGALPVKVTAMPIFSPRPDDAPRLSHVGDNTAIVTCLNDDGSVFKVTGCASFGAHGNSYRICGTKGTIENVRGTDGKIMLRYNAWEKPEGAEEVNFYMPEIHDKDEELIKKAGHGGGDFFVMRHFLNAVRENKKPPFDVYFATTMASVAILAHRSILNGSIPYDIPDFRKEEDRKKYENDNETPFWYTDGRAPTIPCCSKPDYKPSEKQYESYEKALKELGLK